LVDFGGDQPRVDFSSLGEFSLLVDFDIGGFPVSGNFIFG